jgi:glutamate/aspartate transport system substrate-binding protein
MKTNPITAMTMAQLLAAALPCSAADDLVLRVTGQESLPPKWVQHGTRQATGLCPDILAAISLVEPRIRFTGLDDIRSVLVIEQKLRIGSAEIACALVSTPLRHQIAAAVPQPLYVSRQRLAAAADDTADIRRASSRWSPPRAARRISNSCASAASRSTTVPAAT